MVEERSVFERSKHIAARVDGSTSDSTCSREIVKEIRLTNPLQYLPEEYNEIYMYVCINPPLDPRGAKPSSLHKWANWLSFWLFLRGETEENSVLHYAELVKVDAVLPSKRNRSFSLSSEKFHFGRRIVARNSSMFYIYIINRVGDGFFIIAGNCESATSQGSWTERWWIVRLCAVGGSNASLYSFSFFISTFMRAVEKRIGTRMCQS